MYKRQHEDQDCRVSRVKHCIMMTGCYQSKPNGFAPHTKTVHKQVTSRLFHLSACNDIAYHSQYVDLPLPLTNTALYGPSSPPHKHSIVWTFLLPPPNKHSIVWTFLSPLINTVFCGPSCPLTNTEYCGPSSPSPPSQTKYFVDLPLPHHPHTLT